LGCPSIVTWRTPRWSAPTCDLRKAAAGSGKQNDGSVPGGALHNLFLPGLVRGTSRFRLRCR
jgi:hypothetical protein